MLSKLIKKIVSGSMDDENNSTFAAAGITVTDDDVIPDIDHSLSAEKKAAIILTKMTLDEKIDMLSGEKNLAVKGNARLGLPRVWATDASAGVRCFGRSTAFPAPVAMAATWNRKITDKVGEAIAEECRAKGVSILLGPGVNIYRIPTNGRNFEYMGEDPFLAAELSVSYIQGVQRKGVITTVKHLACNNSEYDRHRMDSVVDKRTLHEIYLPPFKAAVQKGGSLSVMSSYNPINGVFASENRYLLTEVLREQWGFKGFVISDWISLYSTEGPVKAGLDLEMPKAQYLKPDKIKKLISQKKISETNIDSMVKNIIKTFFTAGIYNRTIKDPTYDEYSYSHSKISLEAAEESIVLLKNNDTLLPLNKDKIKKIAVIGELSKDTETCGGGSCHVKSYNKINILNGIKSITGENKIVFIDAKNNKLNKNQKIIIKKCNTVIVSTGFDHIDETECYDKSWNLPYSQDRLIRECSKLNKNTIVILVTGSGVETESWIKNVPALIHGFFLGENSGKALANIIFGKTNPSGKLPFTMAKKWNDFESVKYYVKKPEKISILKILGPQGFPSIRKIWSIEYREKLMVGYRHFDTNSIKPQFPFGHGLSFTSFDISRLKLSKKKLKTGDKLTVSVNVKNSGQVSGAEVVQLYINDPDSSLPRPDKELKGFEKIFLNPGETKSIKFIITKEHLSYYDDRIDKWVAEKGKYKILIGNSSRSIFCEDEFELI